MEEILSRLEMSASLRLGTRQMLVRDALSLQAGAMLCMDQHLEEPMELVVSGKVVARGEIVLLQGSYCLEVRDVMTPPELKESLKCMD